MELEKILAKLPEKERRYIEKLIEKDALTGIYNRRKFNQDIEVEVKRAERTGSDLSLFLIDIDNFKQINDTKGHKEGDRVLREIARRIALGMRGYDSIYRYGGEEFAVIVPETTSCEGYKIAERVRKTVEKTGVTISIGVSNYLGSCNSLNNLIDSADKALYQAKNTGKNKTIPAEQEDFLDTG